MFSKDSWQELHCLNPCCGPQGAKGKKKASPTASLHPDILKQHPHGNGQGEDEGQLQKEIEITSVLILRFMEHGDSWDRVQVPPVSYWCLSKPHILSDGGVSQAESVTDASQYREKDAFVRLSRSQCAGAQCAHLLLQ